MHGAELSRLTELPGGAGENGIQWGSLNEAGLTSGAASLRRGCPELRRADEETVAGSVPSSN